MANDESQISRAKCRTVSKQWRDTEAHYIAQMVELLPYTEAQKSQMNKMDVLRLVKTFLYGKKLEAELGGSLHALGEANKIVEVLDGFLLTVDGDGLILHVSEHAWEVLGLQTHRIVGANMREYLHPADHSHFFRQLQPSPHDETDEERSFTVRMKYRIVEKSNRLKRTGFVGLQMKGMLKRVGHCDGRVLVVACYLHCLMPCTELSFFETNYIVRYDKNDRLTAIDHRVFEHWGVNFRPSIGQHFLQSFHPEDVAELYRGPMAFFNQRGSMVTAFHLLTKTGLAIPGVSHDTIVFGPKGEKLFWIGVRYTTKAEKVKIKRWTSKKDILFIFDGYGLPGERFLPVKYHKDYTTSTHTKIDLEEIYNPECRGVSNTDIKVGQPANAQWDQIPLLPFPDTISTDTCSSLTSDTLDSPDAQQSIDETGTCNNTQHEHLFDFESVLDSSISTDNTLASDNSFSDQFNAELSGLPTKFASEPSQQNISPSCDTLAVPNTSFSDLFNPELKYGISGNATDVSSTYDAAAADAKIMMTLDVSDDTFSHLFKPEVKYGRAGLPAEFASDCSQPNLKSACDAAVTYANAMMTLDDFTFPGIPCAHSDNMEPALRNDTFYQSTGWDMSNSDYIQFTGVASSITMEEGDFTTHKAPYLKMQNRDPAAYRHPMPGEYMERPQQVPSTSQLFLSGAFPDM